jgi:hypothetical protein
MAAPTGQPESDDILSRLQAVLDDTPLEPALPEDSREIKDEIQATPPEDKPPQTGEGDEQEPIAAEEADGEKAEVSESEAVTGAEVTDDEINTTAELAKMFDVEESAMLEHLQVDTGDGNSVALSEVISTYKNAPEAVTKWEDFKVREAAFETESAQLRSRTDESIRELAVHAQVLLDMTNEEFKDINWNELKDQDPSQYVFMKERQRERGQVIQAAIEKMKGMENQRTEETAATVQANRSAEISKLHVKMPAWADQAVAQEAMTETSAFLAGAGFSPEEINGITDHRYLLVAYDAAQYRKLQKQAPEKMTTLRGLPKPKSVLRSTARRDSNLDAQQSVRKKFDRLKETGDERDAVRLFEELM